jgi:hypothetical protein
MKWFLLIYLFIYVMVIYLFIYLLVCFLFFILHRTSPLEWAYMAVVYSKFTSVILGLHYLEWLHFS